MLNLKYLIVKRLSWVA